MFQSRRLRSLERTNAFAPVRAEDGAHVVKRLSQPCQIVLAVALCACSSSGSNSGSRDGPPADASVDGTPPSGVHGLPDGSMLSDLSMYEYDAATLGQHEGVRVFNVAEMSPGEISDVINGPGTIIGGFCNSGACLPTLLGR